MPKKSPQSLDDVLGAFTAQLERTVNLPNIYRWEPMPQQDLFLQDQHKNRILFGGNRAGKTEAGAADDVLVLLHRHPHRQHFYPDGQIRMRWIGVDFDKGIDQAALPAVSRLIPPSFLIDGAWSSSYKPANHKLTLVDGSTFDFMSYEQDADKFQAVSLHHIHMDEEPPKAIFDESRLRLLDTNGTWTISETPVQQLEWIQDELIEPSEAGIRPDIKVFYLNTNDNIHLSKEARDELFGTMTEDEKIIRMQGRYKGGSLVFPEFERTWPNVIPDEAFFLKSDMAIYESMDHGYVNPTAWLWTAVSPDGSIVTFEQQYAAGIIVSEWARIVHATRNRICQKYGISLNQYMSQLGATIGDPAIGDQGNASAQTGLTHQQTYAAGGIGIATEGIRAARAGRQNVGLDKIHGYLRKRPATHPRGDLPWWQITSNCSALIDEIKKARKPKQSAANQQVKAGSEEIRDKDNHAIDAIKYLFMLAPDLRPDEYRGADEFEFREYMKELEPSAAPSVTHDAAYAANMAARTAWTVHGSDSYFSMEE
jgi:phage terminase large subunit-like protein